MWAIEEEVMYIYSCFQNTLTCTRKCVLDDNLMGETKGKSYGIDIVATNIYIIYITHIFMCMDKRQCDFENKKNLMTSRPSADVHT